jgi:hypothetical protein
MLMTARYRRRTMRKWLFFLLAGYVWRKFSDKDTAGRRSGLSRR